MSKFPLRIHRVENSNRSRFKVATALEKVGADFEKTQRHLRWFEFDYEMTIYLASATLERLKGQHRKDPRIYWYFVNIVAGFLERISAFGFFLEERNQTLGRDLGISASSIKKALLFHARFPDPGAIDENIPWTEYRNNRITRTNAGTWDRA